MADDNRDLPEGTIKHPSFRPRREPETIDASALDTTPHAGDRPDELPPDAAASEAAAPPDDALSEPSDPASAPRGAAAVVAGALIAVAGAFALHQLDRSPPPAPDPRIAALAAKVDSLAAADPGALARRLDALDRRLADTLPKSALAPLEKHLDAVEAAQRQVATPGTGAATATPTPRVDLTPLEARVAQLEQHLASLEAAVNAPKATARAAEDPQANAAARAAGTAPAVAILAQSLVLNLMRGAPFLEQVQALETLGADKTKLDLLRPAAARGLPNNRKLAADLEPLIAPILTAESAPAPGSLWDRITAGVARLVRVRKLGAGGDDAGAMLARLKAAVLRGDLDEATALWKALPADAKAKSQAWSAMLTTCEAARRAARQLEAEAITALVKARS